MQVEKQRKRPERERERVPVTGKAAAMVDSIGWHAVIGCQGLMFFASGFDRVSDGANYEIHYEARNRMGESYSNADRKNSMFANGACLGACLVCCQRLSSTPPSQAKELCIAAGFVLCFLWVYDFSNAMRAPRCCELHFFGDVPRWSMHPRIDAFHVHKSMHDKVQKT